MPRSRRTTNLIVIAIRRTPTRTVWLKVNAGHRDRCALYGVANGIRNGAGCARGCGGTASARRNKVTAFVCDGTYLDPAHQIRANVDDN